MGQKPDLYPQGPLFAQEWSSGSQPGSLFGCNFLALLFRILSPLLILANNTFVNTTDFIKFSEESFLMVYLHKFPKFEQDKIRVSRQRSNIDGLWATLIQKIY